MDLSMPVTLVIKAPNQKIADLSVECGLEWTIRKLKQHLSAVYPNKPKETQQRIIYSGKLLQDQMMLKDILRQYDPDQTTHVHTVHLVCSPQCGLETNSDDTVTSKTSSSTSSHTSPSVPSPPHPASSSSSDSLHSDGLRHRQTHTTQPADIVPPPVSSNQFQPPQPMHGMNMNNVMDVGYMFPAGMLPYSPEHMVWMQQMYAQQMAQYMQYYQQMYTGGYNVPPTTAATPGMPVNAENLAGAPAGPAPAVNARPAGQQPIRMNAQGGPVLDDDDDEAGNRDWLDWVYTMCRVAVLFSIVYFYSTLGRFMFVFTFFFLIYVYQAGWFRIRRRDVRQAEQPERPQEAAPQQEEPQQPQQQNDEGDGNEAEGGNEDVSEQPDGENAQREEAQEPEQPGALQITWSFVSSFFTSLVPHQPPAVNAN